ncbi:hypothetical protein RHMOL_Rhmol04G0221100 [Rhododendron molle]|uniref:Uncharacterized protein n=1 Tax=Rhododendron molle TaxID=49168 RepID=A0ACC0P3D3_RHOML|nr:hypothetical protein RHMOL_Rhmol04G0221100 [Rhododendron molle]
MLMEHLWYLTPSLLTHTLPLRLTLHHHVYDYAQSRLINMRLSPAHSKCSLSFRGTLKRIHINTSLNFEAFSSTLLIHCFPMDVLRLILFQFTLIGNAKHWLSTLPANSITTWVKMSATFLKKFFPIGKTLRLRQEITTFQQAENEQFYEAWERYGDLIRKCPHHDIPKWQLV